MTPAKGYTEMKDSGIQWIGEVPVHWEITRMKSILENVSIRNHPEAEVLSLYRDLGVLPKNSRDDNHNVTSEDTAQYKYVEVGNLVINKMKAWQGSLAVSNYEGIVSPAYYVCKFRSSKINKRYIHFLVRCSAYAQEFERLSTGMRVGQWDLGISDFMRVPVLLPPFPEQSAIAAYLDTQCAKIDEIIAQAKASIEDYKQWKASIIYEAVTKGLDPNAEMKDSGIEWIPLLPTAIKVSRVGLHFSIILGKMLCPKPLDDTYTLEPYFCAANVHFSGVDSENLKEMWFNPDEKERYRVAPGDLLVVEGGAGAGGCAVIETVDFPIYIQNSIMIVRSKRKNNVKYLKYFLETLVGRGYIDFACNKAIIPHFTKEKLSAVPFPVFDCDTQARIVDFLDSKCGKIDDLIFQKQSLIDDLESYKKSLICEVVTGKRRVV